MSSSKVTIAVFIILIVSIGGLLGFYFYLNRVIPEPQNPIAKNTPTFYGFDQVNLDSTQNTAKNKNLGSFDTDSSTSTNQTPATTTKPIYVLRLISAQPVAGGDFITRNVDISTSSTPTGTSTKEIKLALSKRKLVPMEFIRFILKANGNIYETATSTNELDRLTNVTLTKLQEAYFNTSGNQVIIRNIVGDDGIQTRLMSLQEIPNLATSSIATTTVANLPLNVTEMAMSPDKTRFFYVRNGNPRGTIANLDGGSKIGIFDSPFREWLPQWGSASTIFLNTKPSALAYGYLYSLDVKTSTIKKVLGGVTGLTTLVSKDGKNILYSDTNNNGLQLIVHNIKDTSERTLFAQTMPEKCVWGNKEPSVVYCAVPKQVPNQNNYPDDWYMGTVHFDDSIWKFNLSTGESTFILNPTALTKIPFDITSLSLSKNDDYLVFTDKNTYSFWGLKLGKPAAVITTPTSTTSASSTKTR
ncbi:MAG: hypothetical protein WCG97_00890 [bacterium]